jgi:hypothetical protein
MGGLGNQLFMIFAAFSYAIDHDIKLALHSFKEKTMSNTRTYWNSLLDSFKDIVELHHNEIGYEEHDFGHIPIPDYLIDGNQMIRGYFQSEKYFKHNYDKIIEFMNLRNKIASVKSEYSFLYTKKTIALHFRMGDYIGLQMYHCIKNPDYYIAALKSLEKELELRGENLETDYNILYFCQEYDIPTVEKYIHCIKNFAKINCNFIRVPHTIPDWQQMLLMSSCEHFIIANSTFSWFGAYFSEYSDKIVYHPKIWFGPAYNDKNLSDLFPETWKGIDL